MGGGAMARAVAGQATWLDRAAAVVAAGRFSRPASAAVSAGGQIGDGSVVSSATDKKGRVGLGEWELAGGVEERVVFEPLPTLDEAREATADLKNALELAYLSPGDRAASSLVGPNNLENSKSGKEFMMILPSYPNHVVQAFTMLQENPKAQEVVASLACDKNVWDAVMKNEMVLEFYKTHRINTSLEEPESPEAEATLDTPKENSQKLSEETQIPGDAHSPGPMGFVDFIRVKLEEMASRLSGFVKEIMGGPNPKTLNPSPAFESSGPASSAAAIEFSLGASFIALAIATILTILFKRG